MRDVTCFTAVARHLGFSRAAAELGLSQPAVSQAVGRLERALGIRLFDRTSREVRLTEAGRHLFRYADALLDAAGALSTEAGRLAVPAGPAVRLAYPPLAGTLAARVARRLAARKPPVDVELRPSGWSAATAALVRGDAPAAVLAPPYPSGSVTTARFHVPVEHVALAAGDPFAARPRVRLDRVAWRGLLLPGNRPPGSLWTRLAVLGGGPRRHRVVADDLDDPAAVLDLVASGAGALPVPRILVDTVRRLDVVYVPLDAAGGARLRVTYALAWFPDRMSAELMALVQAVQAALRTR